MGHPALTLVTLGVSDLARSRAFCAAIGFVERPASNAAIAFFQAGPVILALFGRAALAEDAGVAADGSGFRGVSLARNLPSKAAVDDAMVQAAAAGAVIVKPAQDAFWGGYSGYWADPDGHLWELAWNPFFPLQPDGTVRLPS